MLRLPAILNCKSSKVVPIVFVFANTLLIIVDPVPLALRSKSELDSVVVMKLSWITIWLLMSKISALNVLAAERLVTLKISSPDRLPMNDILLSTLIFKLILTGLVVAIFPVPLALNVKSEFIFLVSIKLSRTSILLLADNSLLVILFCILILLALRSITVKSFSITTSLLGAIILPLPLALSCKSALLEVVVIMLSSISISSNCAAAPTVKFCPTVKSSVSV